MRMTHRPGAESALHGMRRADHRTVIGNCLGQLRKHGRQVEAATTYDSP
jgi:hypothetical protein